MVNVGPNTTMQVVLDDICQRRKLDSSLYALKHKRNLLENSLTVRFSGLSSNAMLELVAAAAAVHGTCMVALQLVSGDRKTLTVDSAMLLSQVTTGDIG